MTRRTLRDCFGSLMFERFKSLKDSKEQMRLEEGEEEDIIAVLMISTQSIELLRMTLLPRDLSKTSIVKRPKVNGNSNRCIGLPRNKCLIPMKNSSSLRKQKRSNTPEMLQNK